MSCKKCKINYRRLTKQGYCAECHQEETGTWAEEFTAGKDSKGNPTGNNPMKFRKNRSKK